MTSATSPRRAATTTQARRIVKRLEFHHTSKHASWLKMAEIGFSLLRQACLKGRNPDTDVLECQIAAYQTRRNAARATINWHFSADDARKNSIGLIPAFPTLTDCQVPSVFYFR